MTTAGRLTRTDLPNGCFTEYSYDAAGQVTALSHRKSDNSLIAGYGFTRNSSGMITQVVSSGEPTGNPQVGKADYSFDNANRMLTRQKDGVTINYSFDDNGNLTQRDDGTTTTTYTYDVLNRLTQVADGTHTTSYTYDGHGNRIIKAYDGQPLHYLKEGAQVMCTYNSAGTILRYFIQGPFGMLYSTDETGGNMQIYHADIRGSVAAVSDQSQNTVATYAYDPYGLNIAETGSLDNPYQYVGTLGVTKDENGLYHMHNRYYDPKIKRFVTEDPIGLQGGLNLYAYVSGDPINRVDPQGLNEEWLKLARKARDQALANGASREQAFGIHEAAYAAAKEGKPFNIEQYFPKSVPKAEPVVTSPGVKNAVFDEAVADRPFVKNTNPVSDKKFMQKLYQGRADNNIYGNARPRTHYLDLPKPTGKVIKLIPKPPPVQVYTVDRFTFFFKKVGIQIENILLRCLGSTGLRVTMTGVKIGAKVLNVAASLYTAWEVGWLIGDDMRGWTVWDSVSGRWVTLDDWVADRIDEWDNGDWENQNLGIEHYRMVEKIKLKEFSDELDRVWNMGSSQ